MLNPAQIPESIPTRSDKGLGQDCGNRDGKEGDRTELGNKFDIEMDGGEERSQDDLKRCPEKGEKYQSMRPSIGLGSMPSSQLHCLKNPSSSTSENMTFPVSSLVGLQSYIHSFMHAADMN